MYHITDAHKQDELLNSLLFGSAGLAPPIVEKLILHTASFWFVTVAYATRMWCQNSSLDHEVNLLRFAMKNLFITGLGYGMKTSTELKDEMHCTLVFINCWNTY